MADSLKLANEQIIDAGMGWDTTAHSDFVFTKTSVPIGPREYLMLLLPALAFAILLLRQQYRKRTKS